MEINEGDARSLGIARGERVRLISAVGEVEAAAHPSQALPPGMLFLPLSFPESPASALFDLSWEPVTKAPLFKSCFVRLERSPSHG